MLKHRNKVTQKFLYVKWHLDTMSNNIDKSYTTDNTSPHINNNPTWHEPAGLHMVSNELGLPGNLKASCLLCCSSILSWCLSAVVKESSSPAARSLFLSLLARLRWSCTLSSSVRTRKASTVLSRPYKNINKWNYSLDFFKHMDNYSDDYVKLHTKQEVDGNNGDKYNWHFMP